MAKITMHYPDGTEEMLVPGGYYDAMEMLEGLEPDWHSLTVELDTGLDITADVLAEMAEARSRQVATESHAEYVRMA